MGAGDGDEVRVPMASPSTRCHDATLPSEKSFVNR